MRKAKSRTKAVWARRTFICAVGLLISTLFLQWAFNKSEPLILPLAQRELEDLITDIVYNEVEQTDLSDIVIPCYTEDGTLSHMRTDTAAVNGAVAVIVNEIESVLGDEDIRIAIPVGDIVGDALSLGQGPDILVELNQYKSTRAEARSSIKSAGINHTLHTLTLYLDVEAVVILPGLNTGRINVSVALPIAETLVVGDTPGTYITR